MKKDIDIHDIAFRSGQAQQEWSVPDAYFNDLKARILDHQSNHSARPSDPLEQQRKTLLALAHITAIVQINPSVFTVPEEYFECSKTKLLKKFSSKDKPKGRVMRMRPIWWSTIAASIAVLIAYFAMNKTSDKLPAFNQLLAEVNLTEDDLEWIADEQELADLYLEEMDLSAIDSILPDSTNKQPTSLDTLPAAPNGKTPISSGLPKKLDWESISDDEIWEYLMESDDADELIDL
jgi:hypothetical protein